MHPLLPEGRRPNAQSGTVIPANRQKSEEPRLSSPLQGVYCIQMGDLSVSE
jgi:hypothetical protein